MSETGYRIEHALERGDRDTALSLAEDALTDALDFFIEDGFTDEDILTRMRGKLASMRAE